MSVTPNFSWPLIEPTDFVTNLPADLELLADDIDADVWAIKGTADAALPETIIDAAGDLIYGSAADTAARLPIGTAGQVLTVNSGATAPEWGTVAADSMTVIASGTLSGSAVNITSIPATYKNLQLVVRDFGSSDTSALLMRFDNDSNTRYRATASSVAASTSAVSFGTSHIELTPTQNSSSSDALVIVNIYDYANTSTWKIGWSLAYTNDPSNAANLRQRFGHYVYNQTGAIDEINLVHADTMSGTYILYGVK